MMRAHGLSIPIVAALAIGALVIHRQGPALVWNATASTPIGLYALQPTAGLHAMELVAIEPPKPIAAFLANGGFLPEGGLLLKHVLALAGQTVCRFDHRITIDGIDAGEAKDRDHLNRPLPVWTGCRTIRADEVFVLNPSVLDSLDGRYFGPLPVTSIIGQAMPLWTDEASDGRFIWRATIN
jgi:type IV secretory pathway protease TraF